MNIIDIAIAKQLAGGGGGSGTDSYNDLSNLPKINDVTLSGNKSSSALGLQSEITSDSKLASDLVDDTNQDNKFVTSAEKTTWNGKQNAIDADHKINADYVDDSTSTNKFVTASDKETWNAKQNAIDNSHKLSSDLVDDANHTNKFVTSTEKQTWNAKQNAIDADHKLSSSLVSFSEAEAAAIASGIDSTKVAQISTNQSNILSVLNRTGKNIVNIQAPTSTRGCTFVEGNNGAVTITNAGNWSQFIIENVHVKTNTQYKLVFYTDAISNLPVFNVYLRDHDKDGSALVEGFAVPNTGTIVKDFTSVSDMVSLNIYPDNQSTTVSGTATIRVMICEKTLYDLSNEYTWGVPNYDLTYLQAEDRAALAEEIDAGAKNAFDWSKVDLVDRLSVSNGVFTTTCTDTQTNLRFSLNGLNSSKEIVEYFVGNALRGYQVITTNGIYAFPFTMKSDIVYLRFGHNGAQQNGRGDINVQHLTVGKTYIFVLNITQCSSATSTFKWQDTMICTKAAFGVSQKFVPYRPNMYDYEWQAISTYLLARRSGRTITINGYIANISFTANTATLIGNVNTTVGRPHDSVRTLCNVGANAYSVGTLGYLIVQQDGNIYVTTAYEGTGAVYVSLSYTI